MTPQRRKKIVSILSQRQLDVAVVIDNVWDPHNVGAILRSCDAFGVQRVYLSYTYQSMPHLRDIRSVSAASATQWLSIEKNSDPMQLIQLFQEQNVPIYTTEIGEQAVSPYDLSLDKSAVFVFGNEHQGVSEHWQKAATANVLIPMQGFVESLNVSVAAAICLYEVMKQRLETGRLPQPIQEAAWMKPWLIFSDIEPEV